LGIRSLVRKINY